MLKKLLKYTFLLLILVFLLISAFAGIVFLNTEIPDISTFSKREVYQSTKIYDRTGENLLWEIHGEERRTVVAFENINRHVKNATIAIEDRDFYKHKGLSILGIIRAVVVDILSGEIEQGASTITQQLVKNAILDPRQKWSRKIKEAVISLKIETIYSKDEILGLFLNEVPYGSGAYGVESAAKTYFAKSSNDVTLSEAAYLAAMLQATTYYSPYGNHKEELDDRKNLVLTKMLNLGFINNTEYNEAVSEEVNFIPIKERGIKAPHFVMFIRELISEQFDDNYIERAGLSITTSLDLEMQLKAEEVVRTFSEINMENYNAGNAGLVVIDSKSGEILAMVGSRDYFDREGGGNFNVTTALRQPGSAIKPIIYAAAIEKGYTPDTVIFDIETDFAVEGAKSYIPKNYDNKYRGPVTFKEALAQSINIPAVKVLYLVGLTNALDVAEKLGITSLNDPLRYGLTLVLGGGEVSLLELTSSYTVFANKGVRNPYEAIINIKESNGNIIYKKNGKEIRVLSEKTANSINSILSDNEARAPAFGYNSPLYIENYDVAVKTGTTNDYRDAWTIGYSPEIAVGAWVGNNDNTPMEKKIAGFIVTPMWKSFMEYALTNTSGEKFKDPPDYSDVNKYVLKGEWRGSETYIVDKISGKLATEYTPTNLTEEKVVVSIHNILHWVDKADPRGEIPQSPESDPQYYNWENPLREWVSTNNIIEDNKDLIPKEYDDVHIQENIPVVSLRKAFSKNLKDIDMLTIDLDIKSQFSLARIDVFVNDKFIMSKKSSFDKIILNLSKINDIQTTNKLVLRVYDNVLNKGGLETTFEVELPQQEELL